MSDIFTRTSVDKRVSERTPVVLPARLTWKDQRGSNRFASVVTRDISDRGVFVELQTPISIQPFRLAQFQLEREVRDHAGVPEPLREGRVLAAVYRIVPPTRAGGRQGLALRLMVDPRRSAAPPTYVPDLRMAADARLDEPFASF